MAVIKKFYRFTLVTLLGLLWIPVFAADVVALNTEALIVHLTCIKSMEQEDKSGSVYTSFSEQRQGELYLIFGQMPEDRPVCGSFRLGENSNDPEVPYYPGNLRSMMNELMPAVNLILKGTKAVDIDPSYFHKAVSASNIEVKLISQKSNVDATFKEYVQGTEREARLYARLAQATLGQAIGTNTAAGGVAAAGGGNGGAAAGAGAVAVANANQGERIGLGGNTIADGGNIPAVGGSAATAANSSGLAATGDSFNNSIPGASGQIDEDVCAAGQTLLNGSCTNIPSTCNRLSGNLLTECVCLNKNPPGNFDAATLRCNDQDEVGNNQDEEIIIDEINEDLFGEDDLTDPETENAGSNEGQSNDEALFDEEVLFLPELPEIPEDINISSGGNGSGNGSGASNDFSNEINDGNEIISDTEGESGFNEENIFGSGSADENSNNDSGSGGLSGGNPPSNAPVIVGDFSDGLGDSGNTNNSNPNNNNERCPSGHTRNVETGNCEICIFDAGGGSTQAGCTQDFPSIPGGGAAGSGLQQSIVCDPDDLACSAGNVSGATGDILTSLQLQTSQAAKNEIYGLLPPSPVYTYRYKGYNVKQNSEANSEIPLSQAAQASWNNFTAESKESIFGEANNSVFYDKQFEIHDKSCILGKVAYGTEDAANLRVTGIDPRPEIFCNAHSKMWELAIRDAIDHVDARVEIQNKLATINSQTAADELDALYFQKFKKGLTSSQKEMLAFRVNEDNYQAVNETSGYQEFVDDDFFGGTNSADPENSIRELFKRVGQCNDAVNNLEQRIATCLVFGSASQQEVQGACAVGEVTTCKMLRMKGVNRLIKNKVMLEQCLSDKIQAEGRLAKWSCTLFPNNERESDYSCLNGDLTEGQSSSVEECVYDHAQP